MQGRSQTLPIEGYSFIKEHSTNPKLTTSKHMLLWRQCLCHAIGYHVCSRCTNHLDLTSLNSLTHIVRMQLCILASIIDYRLAHDPQRTLVIVNARQITTDNPWWKTAGAASHISPSAARLLRLVAQILLICGLVDWTFLLLHFHLSSSDPLATS
jgi:hypothetical protein